MSLFFFSVYGQANLHTYTTKSGLSSNTIYAITVDKEGFIWLGTKNGLSRFDGQVFKTYSIIDGLPTNEILNVICDSMNRIWFFGIENKLGFIQNGQIHNQQNDSQISKLIQYANESSVELMSFVEPEKGKLIVVIGNRNFSLLNNEWVPVNQLKEISYKICLYNDSLVFNSAYNTKYTEVYNIKSNRVSHILMPTEIKATGKWLDFNGKIITYYNDLIWVCSYGSNQINMVDSIRMPSHVINIGVQQNKLYVSTNVGVNYIIDSTFYIEEIKALHGKVVTSFLYNKHTLFASTLNDGLLALNFSSGMFMNIPRVSSLELLKDKDLVVATKSIFDYKINSKTLATTRHNNSIGYVGARKVFGVDDNLFFIGDAGLLKKEGKRYTLFPVVNGGMYALKNYHILDSNYILIANLNGVYKFNVNNFTCEINNPLFIGRATAILNQKDKLWVGTSKGLYLNGRKVKLLNRYNLYVDPDISEILLYDDSTIVVSTYNLGLYIKKGSKVYNISILNGLNSNLCNTVSIDKSHNKIWVATDRGLNSINFVGREIYVEDIRMADSHFSEEVIDVLTEDSLLWVATKEGVFVHPIPIDISPKNVPIYWEKYYVQDSALYFSSDTISILSGEDIIINFIANKFGVKDANCSYRYKFTNDIGWIPTNTESIVLTGLKPGRHELVIEPIINSTPLSQNRKKLTVYVIPKFFEYPIVIGLVILLTVLLIGFIVFGLSRHYFRIREEVLINKAKSSALELDLVRSQIKPHFIFNILNSIYYFLLEGNSKLAQSHMLRVSRLIRKSLHLSKQPFILLSEEIEFIENYVSIEKLRFEEKFDFGIHVSPALKIDDVLIPSLFLQPIIENAINHGLSSRKDDLGLLSVNFTIDDSNVICTIEDNGIGIKKSIDSKKNKQILHQSMGQDLIQRRIALIRETYEINISITTEILMPGDPYEGTRVIVVIPLNIIARKNIINEGTFDR